MQCFRCTRPAVYYQRYSGRSLCAVHLCADIESRAKRVIRQNRWLTRGDRIGVVQGMIHSAALLQFLDHLLSRRPDISLVRIDAPQSYVQGSASWYRALSQTAEDARVTRVAFPTCAEELAEEILAGILRGETASLLLPGNPGVSVPVIHPLQEIPAQELELYTSCVTENGDMTWISPVVPDDPDPFHHSVKMMLTEFSLLHPSAPHALRRYRMHLRGIAGAD